MSKAAISLGFCSLLCVDEYKLPAFLRNIAIILEMNIVYVRICCKTWRWQSMESVYYQSGQLNAEMSWTNKMRKRRRQVGPKQYLLLVKIVLWGLLSKPVLCSPSSICYFYSHERQKLEPKSRKHPNSQYFRRLGLCVTYTKGYILTL